MDGDRQLDKLLRSSCGQLRDCFTGAADVHLQGQLNCDRMRIGHVTSGVGGTWTRETGLSTPFNVIRSASRLECSTHRGFAVVGVPRGRQHVLQETDQAQ